MQWLRRATSGKHQLLQVLNFVLTQFAAHNEYKFMHGCSASLSSKSTSHGPHPLNPSSNSLSHPQLGSVHCCFCIASAVEAAHNLHSSALCHAAPGNVSTRELFLRRLRSSRLLANAFCSFALLLIAPVCSQAVPCYIHTCVQFCISCQRCSASCIAITK